MTRRTDHNWRVRMKTVCTTSVFVSSVCLSAFLHVSCLRLSLNLSACLYFCLLSLCPFISCAAGRLWPPDCSFWSFRGDQAMSHVSTHVSTTKGNFVFQHKQPLLCNALMLLFLTTTESRRKTEGKRRHKDGTTTTDREPSGPDELCVLYCLRPAPTRFLYFVYSHAVLHSVLHRGQQHSSMTSLTGGETKLLSPPPSISNLTDEAMRQHPRCVTSFCCYVWPVCLCVVLYWEEGSLLMASDTSVCPCRV